MRKLAIKAAAKLVKDAFVAKGAKITHTEALDLIAKLQGFEAWSHLSQVVPVAPLKAAVSAAPPSRTLKEVFTDHYGAWGQCGDFPKCDWRYETENDDTTLGYWDWALDKLEDKGLLESYVIEPPLHVTLPEGSASTWTLQQNLSTRDGDINDVYFERKPALTILLADADLLEKLRKQMYSEDTFIVYKDNNFGILWELEFCSTASDGDDPQDGWKPHDVVVAALLEGLAALAPEYPNMEFCVPDPRYIVRDRPAVWGFVPVDAPLTPAQQEALSAAIGAL